MDVQPHLLNLSAYINQNLEKDLPLMALAKRVGLSPFHFHRKFGAYFGESLHQHIKRLRLERAAFALTHGSSPVRQIARDSGYKTVSAFSHAFSGFAGESPTRYRLLANSRDGASDRGDTDSSTLEPNWVGDVPAQAFAFLRSTGREGERPLSHALALLLRLVGPLEDGADERVGAADGAATSRVDGRADAAASDDSRFDGIAATSDVYGVFKGGEFRIDVGLDAGRVPPDRVAVLGRQTLPGGRYARYDLRCRLEDVFQQCRRVSLRTLQERGEAPRLSQYFVRFATVPDADGDRDEYRLYVPLVC